jgi:hypothetical protein
MCRNRFEIGEIDVVSGNVCICTMKYSARISNCHCSCPQIYLYCTMRIWFDHTYLETYLVLDSFQGDYYIVLLKEENKSDDGLDVWLCVSNCERMWIIRDSWKTLWLFSLPSALGWITMPMDFVLYMLTWHAHTMQLINWSLSIWLVSMVSRTNEYEYNLSINTDDGYCSVELRM